jgi:hypothetical protein
MENSSTVAEQEKKGLNIKEYLSILVPALFLLALLVYVNLNLVLSGQVCLTTPSVRPYAEVLVEAIGKENPDLNLRLIEVEQADPTLLEEKGAIFLVAPESPELLEKGALPIGVDALVVAVSLDNSASGFDRVDLEKRLKDKKTQIYLPPKDLIGVFEQKLLRGQANYDKPSYFLGKTLGKDEIVFLPWTKLDEDEMKAVAFNGVMPNSKNIRELQFPTWFQVVILFPKGEQARMEKLVKSKSFQKKIRSVGLFSWSWY